MELLKKSDFELLETLQDRLLELQNKHIEIHAYLMGLKIQIAHKEADLVGIQGQIEQVLNDVSGILKARKQTVSSVFIAKFIIECAEKFQVDSMRLANHIKTRKSEIIELRQPIHYFLAQFTTLTLQEIGDVFKMDHSTVIHSREAVLNIVNTLREIEAKPNAVLNDYYARQKEILTTVSEIFEQLLPSELEPANPDLCEQLLEQRQIG